MSVRLVTTPWLTKNLAGGGLDTRRLLGGRQGTGRPDGTAPRPRPDDPGIASRPRIIRAMLLALDIGNTNVTVGLFRAGALLATRRAATDPRATADELELLLDGLLRLDGIGARRPRRDRARVGRPGADRRRSRSIAERRDRPLLVGRAPGTVPLAVRVDRPGDVGADRLVNALAAARLHGTPAVVVDFGTATTFDCVAADGAYVGGAIAPGLELGPRGARGTDRQAAADRAARPGPGDRPGHRRGDPVRHGPRLPGARRRACSPGSAASWPTPTVSRRPRSGRS